MTTTPEGPITVSRAQLYRQVWEEPVRTVAERYHVSDVALAKTCRRHRIPVPGRGYWARRQAGYHDRRPPLPRLKPGERDEITIHRVQQSPEEVSKETAALIAAENAPEQKIEAPPELTDPHPHVARAAKSFRASRTSGGSQLVPRARPRLDLRVTEATLERALRVMDTLLKALERRGYEAEVGSDGKYTTSAIVLDERVFFFIEEPVRLVEHKPTPEERLQARRAGWQTWPRRDSVPTGTLRLRIVDSGYWQVRTAWADGKRQQVEDCLNDFVAGLLAAAEAIKRRRAERVEWERRRKEEEARWMEAERLRRLEEARAQELMRQADAWDQVRRVRAYLARAREAGVVHLPDGVEIETLDHWIRWASEYANQLDPFRDKPDATAEL